jgi:hypothetical protein
MRRLTSRRLRAASGAVAAMRGWRPASRRVRRRELAAVLAAAASLLVVAGCLEKPELDQQWTLLQFLDVAPTPDQSVSGNQPLQVNVRGRITYRQILTGFLVAEVRYSDTVSPQTLKMDPDTHTLAVAESVDRVLANSVSVGRATRAVTGFDHLMQDVTLSFTANIPPQALAGGPGGVYLLLYMGSGDKMRLANGTDSLVVTPFVSTQYEVLHSGFPLDITGP